VKLFYVGAYPIKKPNLTLFRDALRIPLTFIGNEACSMSDLFPGIADTLLITADCQYGAGNVWMVPGDAVCVIDHHIKEKDLARFECIEPYCGSCATVVWKLLRQAGFDFSAHPDVATALYYGLYTDTNNFAELFHPTDRDMLEGLHFDAKLIRCLKGSNLAREELLLAGKALSGARYDDALGTAVFAAEPCDPNILGFISDLTLQVQNVEVTVGFNRVNHGVKLSIRSATPEVMANELAAYLTEGYGNGGGTKEKAGGFLKRPDAKGDAGDFIRRRLDGYFASYDKIVAGDYVADTSAMQRYRKKNVPLGYVRLTELYP
jgi:phosphoglycolate phosphatase